MDLFQSDHYLDVIQKKIIENKNVYGYKAKLAAAARCQRSYFSQVLRSKVHLTPEHSLALSQFWAFDDKEALYFFLLVSRERSATKELKKFFDKKLSDLRQEQEVLGSRYNEKSAPIQDQSLYYSNWLYSAIHMLLTVPKYQSLPALSERLQISQSIISKILVDLENIQLVKREGNKWICTEKTLHVSMHMPFNFLNHQNWRARALLSSAEANPKHLHYTAIYSLSLEDIKQFQAMLLKFVDKTRSLVAPSREEEVICFNCDFFKI